MMWNWDPLCSPQTIPIFLNIWIWHDIPEWHYRSIGKSIYVYVCIYHVFSSLLERGKKKEQLNWTFDLWPWMFFQIIKSIWNWAGKKDEKRQSKRLYVVVASYRETKQAQWLKPFHFWTPFHAVPSNSNLSTIMPFNQDSAIRINDNSPLIRPSVSDTALASPSEDDIVSVETHVVNLGPPTATE